jgi:hypothetical protein
MLSAPEITDFATSACLIPHRVDSRLTVKSTHISNVINTCHLTFELTKELSYFVSFYRNKN